MSHVHGSRGIEKYAMAKLRSPARGLFVDICEGPGGSAGNVFYDENGNVTHIEGDMAPVEHFVKLGDIVLE